MNLTKIKPLRSKKYLDYVRSLACCVTGIEGRVVAHHIIDCGMGGCMGGKQSDLFAIPLDAEVHAHMHHNGFEGVDQKAKVLRIIEMALNDGVLKIE